MPFLTEIVNDIDRIFDQDFIDTKVEQEVEFKLKRKLRHWEKIQCDIIYF